jgi:hypothetical protein
MRRPNRTGSSGTRLHREERSPHDMPARSTHRRSWARALRTPAFVSCSCPGPRHDRGNLTTQGRPGSLSGAWQCADHDVRTRGRARKQLVADRLQAAPYSIAHDSDPDGLGHDEPEARRQPIRTMRRVHHGMRTGRTATAAHSVAVITGAHEPVGPGQHRGYVMVGLSGELGAPLAATSTEDCAAGTGTHAQTETVDLRTTTVVRLESSLAHNSISTCWNSARPAVKPRKVEG